MTEQKSRTYRSIQNSVVGLGFYLIALILSFVSRKVYIDHLGTELLGLNTTAQNLLGFLNLAELGIGSAIACTLYKPLFDRNEQSINEIVSLQGWLYKRIAMIVGGGAMILMAFFPLIFKKTELPLGYAYLSFGVFLFSSLLSYFINFRTIVISANQKDYLIRGCNSTVQLIKVIVQILAVKYLANPYFWWCALEVIFAVIASYAMQRIVKKDSPYLNTKIEVTKDLRNKYPHIIIKVKQLFFHKIGGLILFQSEPIILYAFTSLSTVALIGNYYAITNSLKSLINSGLGNMGASVGNLISEGDKRKTMSVFNELFSMRFFIAAVTSFGVFVLASPFVSLWLGNEYVLSQATVSLLSINIFIAISRGTVDDYYFAKGIFSDIWAPIVEAAINISCSIGLGYHYGLNGVLCGGVISQIVIVLIWKPYFLFTHGLNEPIKCYVLLYSKHIIALILCYMIILLIGNFVSLYPKTNIFSSIIYAIIFMSLFTLSLYFMLYMLSEGMRNFTNRVFNIIKRR